ncbi:hypothetical protein B566_EDAN010432, partial [Ephemera danica]
SAAAAAGALSSTFSERAAESACDQQCAACRVSMAPEFCSWTALLILLAASHAGGDGANNERVRAARQQPVAQPDRKQPQTVTDLFVTDSCLDKPYKCPHHRIQFFLYTRTTQTEPELLDLTDPLSLIGSNFNVSHPTKVVIHGFGGGRNLSPSPDMREAYFTRGDYNVIIVDYGSLVKEPCLSQIGWGPRFCALCIAQLVDYLDRVSGTPPSALHLVGYSVGAHIAGLVANYLPDTKLGRITGLDPSVVFYQGSNSSRDLDLTDANFVDVIHTGAGVLGQWGPTGHADFYVNGGTSQPGCGGTLFQTLSCDHTKVTPYFIESIVSEKGFWAAPCSSFLNYMLGWCNPREEDYIRMGEDAPHTARGEYYLETNAHPPFAKGFPVKQQKRQQPQRKRPQQPQQQSKRQQQQQRRQRPQQQDNRRKRVQNSSTPKPQ